VVAQQPGLCVDLRRRGAARWSVGTEWRRALRHERQVPVRERFRKQVGTRRKIAAQPNVVVRSLCMQTASRYSGFAKSASRFCGRPRTFALAVAVIAVWIVTGPIFAFSDTWQLVINTGTTIVTFLMVFLIQNTQNRDTEAIQIKLDELIRATKGAHNALLDLEELEEDALDAFRRKYQVLAASAREGLGLGNLDTGTPEA
jgi:low affinity Fe/Cu permease